MNGMATRAVATATAAATAAAAAGAAAGMRAAAEGLTPPSVRAAAAGHGAAAGASGPGRPAAAAKGDDWTSLADDGDGRASADGDGGCASAAGDGWPAADAAWKLYQPVVAGSVPDDSFSVSHIRGCGVNEDSTFLFIFLPRSPHTDGRGFRRGRCSPSLFFSVGSAKTLRVVVLQCIFG